QHTHIDWNDLKSGDLKQVTEGNEHFHLSTWSPNGSYLTYLADGAEELDFSFNADIYLFDLETKQSRKVTEGIGSYYQTSWSPNS
ncbi:TolB family protein, partial [Lysinibacillus sp. D4B1_S16]|uniref:TolB family protein n=1 Tax=Lysinibacillus sp. D4B1_S16 TaxID=2941231 RepID=UPI0037C8AF09